jgi:type IV secretory pathway VirB9-like protein
MLRTSGPIILLTAGLSLSACAGHNDPPALPETARFVPAVTLPAETAPEEVIVAPVQKALKTAPLATLPPPAAVPVVFEPPKRGKGRRIRPTTLHDGGDPVSTAERGSLLTPSRGGYADATSAVLRYPYRTGAVYLITTAPTHPTTLLLPPGLRLAVPPSLDPESWDVGFAEMGKEDERQEAILLRPATAGLEATTPLLTKSGHLLLCRLKSQDKPAVLAVTWELPIVKVVTPGAPVKEARSAGPGAVKAPQIDVARLHTQYRIEPGTGAVNWVPVEAYDDGTVTVIRWAESLTYTAAPILTALAPGGKKTVPLEYTTYSVPGHPEKGEFYVTRGLYPRV